MTWCIVVVLAEHGHDSKLSEIASVVRSVMSMEKCGRESANTVYIIDVYVD